MSNMQSREGSREANRYNKYKTRNDNYFMETNQGNKPVLTGEAIGGEGYPTFMEELLTSQQVPRKKSRHGQRTNSRLRTNEVIGIKERE